MDFSLTIPEKSVVLIIDDNPANLSVLADYLEAYGIEVLVSQDGESGLEKARSVTPDLILLDILLPGIDGFETCRLLKKHERTKQIPVVFITALTDTESKIRGFQAGALDYITKPFRKEEVFVRVATQLRIRQLTENLEDTVRQRTTELTETNLRLQEEIENSEKSRSALQQSEKKFRELFNRLPDVFYRTDTHGNITLVSPSCYKVIGYRDAELIGKKMETLHVNPEEREALLKRLAEKGIVEGFEVQLRRKDGSIICVSTNSAFYYYDAGNLIGVEGIARDITQIALLEKQVRQAQKMEAIGTLAGGIAHDFNNILCAIMGYIELALDDLPGNAPVLANLEKAMKGAVRARELVQQILTFSRQTEIEPKPVIVSLIVKEALKLLRASLPSSIEIRASLESRALVLADPTQFHQIVMNLCTNAGYAMRKNGGILDIRLQEIIADAEVVSRNPGIQPGRFLKFTVCDTGEGIPSEMLERIFDPFFTTKDKNEGTGMGLAMVHGIIKRIGGAVSVSSEPGKGASFTVLLPVSDAEVQTEKEERPVLRTGVERILVVDDEALIVDAVGQTLSRLGYRVQTETDSIQALKKFKKNPEAFDLVITDMTMPNMNGDSLARNLIQIRKDIPIIITTGYSELLTKEMINRLGISRMIMKPVSRNDLAETVRKVLDSV